MRIFRWAVLGHHTYICQMISHFPRPRGFEKNYRKYVCVLCMCQEYHRLSTSHEKDRTILKHAMSGNSASTHILHVPRHFMFNTTT